MITAAHGKMGARKERGKEGRNERTKERRKKESKEERGKGAAQIGETLVVHPKVG